MFVSYCIFSNIVLIFHIFKTMQDNITMPQQTHMHRNHPLITPHPKPIFLPDLSVCRGHQSCCITASLSYLPSQKSLRFLTHHHHPPSNTSPPHIPSHTSRVHTHTYVTDPRLPTSLLHSPEHITVTLHVQSYTSLPHPPSKQTDAITKVNNWMNCLL